MAMSKNQLRKALTDLGVEFSANMEKPELEALYEKAIADGGLEVAMEKDDGSKFEDTANDEPVFVSKGQATLAMCMRQFCGKSPLPKDKRAEA